MDGGGADNGENVSAAVTVKLMENILSNCLQGIAASTHAP